MFTRRVWMSSLFMFLSLLIANHGFAQNAAFDFDPEAFRAEMDARLNLTEEQKRKSQPHFAAFAESLSGIRSRIKSGELKRFGAFREIRKERETLDAELDDFLTSDQMEELGKIRAERRKKFMEKRRASR